jgi:hypothetical protein
LLRGLAGRAIVTGVDAKEHESIRIGTPMKVHLSDSVA